MQNKLSKNQKNIVQMIVEKQVYLRNIRSRRYNLSLHSIERFVERFNISSFEELNNAWKELAEAFSKSGQSFEEDDKGGIIVKANGIVFVLDDTNYIIKTIYKEN